MLSAMDKKNIFYDGITQIEKVLKNLFECCNNQIDEKRYNIDDIKAQIIQGLLNIGAQTPDNTLKNKIMMCQEHISYSDLNNRIKQDSTELLTNSRTTVKEQSLGRYINN